jgi:hypothetical protein
MTGEVVFFRSKHFRRPPEALLWVVFSCALLTLGALVYRGLVYDPFANLDLFMAQSRQPNFEIRILVNMLAVILTIFNFFALAAFLAHFGDWILGILACVLSTCGMALVLSVLGIMLHMAPHMPQLFAQTHGPEYGFVKSHLPLVIAVIVAMTFGVGSVLFTIQLRRLPDARPALPWLYLAYSLLTGVAPLILVSEFPLAAHISEMTGAAIQVLFALALLQYRGEIPEVQTLQ